MRAIGVSTGPTVVAVGGGHGLAASLRAARRYASAVTAIVSVADDGGSSGRLRELMPDLPAPGDVRRCLGALADPDESLTGVLEHRFDDDAGELAGHAFGNLLLAALTFGLGTFPAAVDEVARLAGVSGRVLPATVGPVGLAALAASSPDGDQADGDVRRVVGQVEVANTGGVRRLSLEPPDAASPPGVAQAILAADQVIIGPGSLFTSVLAAAIVPQVRKALHDTAAQRVYVANLGPQVPETEGFTLADHLDVLAAHDVPVDVVLCQPGIEAGVDRPALHVVARPVADRRGLVHAPEPFAIALSEVLNLAR